MVKVESKETLWLLTRRFMKMNKGRNVIAVLSILLTTLLFTSLFMGCVSLVLSRRASEIKQFMNSAHAVAQDVPKDKEPEVVAALKENGNIERYGVGIFLGSAMDESFRFSAEVRYGDENVAEGFNCLPTEGAMPKEADEIALSTIVLDALGISHELGERVRITWEADPQTGRNRTDTFRLCGYWEGDQTAMAQILWVCADYAKEYAHPLTQEEADRGYINGGYDYNVWYTKKACYQNLWDFGQLSEELSKSAGFAQKDSGFLANPAYSIVGEDSFSFQSAAVMLLFILLAGYLIIYNVFNISVQTDIRTYGLLKNVGTTGRQLKKCVRMQALLLSAVGIPIGLAAGFFTGVWMAPSLSANGEISAQAVDGGETVISANPAIFILAGLFALLTVYLSSLRACKVVEKVSPVEALRRADSEQTQKKGKKNTSASWYGMAMGNFERNWKRGMIVMLSISLSLVVVDCIVMLVQGQDFDSFKEIYIAADFQLDQISSFDYTNYQGITPNIKEALDACPYSQKPGYVYYSSEKYDLAKDPELLKLLQKSAKEQEESWYDSQKEIWNKLKEENKITVHFYGINEAVFDKLEWKGEPCTWEEFAKEDYVLADFDGCQYQETSYFQKGDIFQMDGTKAQSKEYKVLGGAWLPYALEYPFWDFMYLNVIVPEDEYIRQTKNSSAMRAAIDAKKGEEKQVKQYIDEEILSQNDSINLSSVLIMQESFGRYIRKYYIIGAFLVAVLAFIGIMNFFNTTAASVLSRKKELALLEAVGMTKKQILKMLVAEGCIYLGGAFVLAVLAVYAFAGQLLASTLGNTFFFRMQLTVMPCIAMLPVLAFVAYAIPKFQFCKMSRESVVERIREQ